MSQVQNNELWQAFHAEVSEQLDNLELILSAEDAETSADIHQLFRDFHTIKSSCAMMDFHSMKDIAHASEDYLDLVRKGRTALNAATISDLLHGIDWLKAQLQLARTSGNPPTTNAALLETLRQLSRGIAVSTNHSSSTSNESAEQQQTATDSADNIALSEDEVREFASACQQDLVVGLTPDTEPAKIKRSLNKLVSICNLLGFSGIATLLKKYIKVSNPMIPGRAATLAAEIISRITTIETRYHVDCGTPALRTIYLDAMFADFAQLSGRLDFLLDLIEQNPDNNESVEECEALLQRLATSAALFGYEKLLVFFRYVLQVIRSIRRNDIPDHRAAFYAVRQAVDFPIAEQYEEGETEAVRQALLTRIAELNDSITQVLHNSASDNHRHHIAQQLLITDETLDMLMPDSLSALSHAIENHQTVCEIDIALDCPIDTTELLIRWMSDHGNIVHNRSIFAEKTTGSRTLSSKTDCTCFIVTSTATLSTIERALQKIDPESRFTHCRDIKKNSEAQPQATTKKQTTHQDAVKTTQNSATLRIDSHILEELMAQTGETIMTHNALAHEIHLDSLDAALNHAQQLLAKTQEGTATQHQTAQWQTILSTLLTATPRINQHHAKFQQSTLQLQRKLLDLRVTPVATVFNRIPQLVQKMAETQGKKIDLTMTGNDVRIDKGMVDVLMEPLIHLVRNCIDHGIEPPEERQAAGKADTAALTLSASQEGSTLSLKISDDGRGINLARIRESAIRKGFIQASDVLTDQETCKLIFLPGFSTTEVITETSGRGVGMDVVITRINLIGGDIDVDTTPGYGTRFTMTLPLSAAIQGVVMLTAGDNTYAIAQGSISSIATVPACDIQRLMGQSVWMKDNQIIPLFQLEELVHERGTPLRDNSQHLRFTALPVDVAQTVLLIGQERQRIGICVDIVHGREDIFVRELHKSLRKFPAICGATARSGGQVAFILNSQFLLQYAQRSALVQMRRAEEQVF
ncbi:MAG: Hpt domain-containing protein [Pseudomonadales bacterium]|nr:Hpt domain-containing protein [Pseudomonadales bacterium]